MPKQRKKFSVCLMESIRSKDECWPWTGSYCSSNGYPMARRTTAHRAVYEAMIGPIPPGLELDHLCKNPPCVNPSHMEPVTQRVNNMRSNSVAAIAARKESCINGHPFNAENTYLRNAGTDHQSRMCRTCRREKMRFYNSQKCV